MQDIMLDLETLGTEPNAVIMSIGMVAFDAANNKLGPEFYTPVSVLSSIAEGFRYSDSTLNWWERQTPAARAVLADALTTAITPRAASNGVREYLQQFSPDVRVWGNGAAFDNELLRGYLRKYYPVPMWKFWNDRCYRTLNALMAARVEKTDPLAARVGTYHNALDDAKTQALRAMQMLRAAEAEGLPL